MKRGQAKSRCPVPMTVPTIWLMTDARIEQGALIAAMARLPRGAGIVLRHYDLPVDARRTLFKQARRIAMRRGLILLLAGDPQLARRWQAHGHHGRAPAPRGVPQWLHSAPVHDQRERVLAQRAGADLLFVSPLFATRSHPDARPLGAFRFAAIARAADCPVMALGGVRRRHGALVRRLGAAGFGAIDGLVGG